MRDTDLANYPGLYRRDGNGLWYIRRRVPGDLRPVEPRFQIRISLETADVRKAKAVYHLKMAEISEGFRLQRVATAEWDGLGRSLALGRIEDLGRNELQKLVLDWWSKREACRKPVLDVDDDPSEVLAALSQDTDLALEAAQGEPPFTSTVDRLLVAAGVASKPLKVGAITTAVQYPAVDKKSPAYLRLCELVGRAIFIEEELARDHITGGQSASYDPIFNPAGVRKTDQPIISASTVRNLIDEFRAEREQVHSKESTDRKYGLLFRILAELWGADLPTSKITRSMCVDVYTFLKKLPPNATKTFPAMTLVEAMEHAQKHGLQGLRGSTPGSYMQNLYAILNWASAEAWGIDVNTKGIVKKAKQSVRRRGFLANELTKLFSALVPLRENSPGKFWVTALALYTGARQGELCQLRTEDVISVCGIWCLDLSIFTVEGLRDADKRQKTEASERIVPLHDEVLAMGFLEHVQSQTSTSLFPDLTVSAEGSRSENFSKWFGRFRKSVGLGQPATVFHSFRHGFRDACRDADIPEETAHALGGWASENEGQRYGKRGAVPNLHRALKRIGYGEFRLSDIAKDNHGHSGDIGTPDLAPILQPVAT